MQYTGIFTEVTAHSTSPNARRQTAIHQRGAKLQPLRAPARGRKHRLCVINGDLQTGSPHDREGKGF